MQRRGGRTLGLALVAAVFAAVAGCTSQTPDVSSGPATAPSPTATSLFGGSVPMSAAAWWHTHPETAPDTVAGDTVLLDRQGTGAAFLPMPDLHGYTHVTVVLVCTQQVRYVVQMTTRTDPSWGWTGGDSCGGPDLGIRHAWLDPAGEFHREGKHTVSARG